MRSTVSILVLVSVGLFAPWVAKAAQIAPGDAGIRYIGRFDSEKPAGPRCAWSASTVTFTVSGGSVNVRLKDGGKNFWQVVINGEAAGVLALQAGEQVYSVVKGLPAGRHASTAHSAL